MPLEVHLGWNEVTATRAVAAVEADQDEELTVPELLRAALRHLGGGGHG